MPPATTGLLRPSSIYPQSSPIFFAGEMLHCAKYRVYVNARHTRTWAPQTWNSSLTWKVES